MKSEKEAEIVNSLILGAKAYLTIMVQINKDL